MQCDHFDAGRCRSCRWMGTPYAAQVVDVADLAAGALPQVPAEMWEPVATGPETGFRNKAKMVVGGSTGAPTLGILDGDRTVVDLRDCGIHDPRLVAALPVLADHVGTASLVPYDVRTRRGELKHLLVTVSPDGDLMVRWVLRSTESLPRLRKHLATLQEALGTLAVASVNVQPAHAAVLEGPEEHLLTDAGTLHLTLPSAYGGLPLRLRPGGFWQTNHHVAAQLYDTAASWLTAPTARGGTWDLYSGVGGFALALAAAGAAGRSGVAPGAVIGVETSAEAVQAASDSAHELGVAVQFVVADAGTYAASADRGQHPGTVVVNPPRRGIGDLATWLDESPVERVLYSSCHLGSLAADVRALAGWHITRARVFDMFPQTSHVETMVLLERRG